MSESSYPTFNDKSLRTTLCKDAANRTVSAEVIQGIVSYNQKLQLGESAKQNLEAIQRAPFAAVVTGQQLGVLGGPIMTLLKAISCCKVAEQLTEETGVKTVPFFWLQAEDHDFDEIKAFNFLTREGDLSSLSINQSTAIGTSLNFEQLNDSIHPLLEAFDQNFSHLPAAVDLSAILKESYSTTNSLSQAFAKLYSWLFQSYGLLFINPWQAEFSKIKQTVFTKALTESSAIQALLLRAANKTIHVRENSPLFFYHPEGTSSARYRIVGEGDLFKLVGSDKTVTRTTLSDDLQALPEKFSASALLRPIFQDSLLPTAAYIGGAAEVSYFQQISEIYPLFGLNRPFLLERLHARLIDPKSSSLLQNLALAPSQLETDSETLHKLLSQAGLTRASQIASAKNSIEQELSTLIEPLEKLDKTLLGALENAKAKINYQLDNLASRIQKAEATKSETATNRLAKLSKIIYPNNTPQERFLSALPFLALCGRGLIDKLYDTVSPLELNNKQFKDIYL